MIVTRQAVLKELNRKDIPFVIIGGIALTIYGCPRTMYDMDLAIAEIDVENVIGLMYHHNFCLAASAGKDGVTLCPSEKSANRWTDQSRTCALSFIYMGGHMARVQMAYTEIDITTQVDFRFALGIPFVRLKQAATFIETAGIPVRVASREHLLVLKELENPPNAEDIAFLKKQIDAGEKNTKLYRYE